MNPKLITAATGSVLQLGSTKAFLRVDADAMDVQIEEAITAAESEFERKTGRALLSSTWELALNYFPSDYSILLPKGEASSVAWIKYYDTANVEATFPASSYALDLSTGEVRLTYGQMWPTTTLRLANPISIRYVAGWADSDSVPASIKLALRMHVLAQIDPPRQAAEINRYAVMWDNAIREWALLC